MKGNGSNKKRMAKENLFGLMKAITKANLRKIKPMDMGKWSIGTEMFMKGFGWMIWQKVKAYLYIAVVSNIMVTGKVIKRMVKDIKRGQILLNIRVDLLMEK